MKKPLAILLIFSLLSPYFVSAQSDPCQDKEFLRLKDVSINDMSDREYKYFMMMSERCTGATKTAPTQKTTPPIKATVPTLQYPDFNSLDKRAEFNRKRLTIKTKTTSSAIGGVVELFDSGVFVGGAKVSENAEWIPYRGFKAISVVEFLKVSGNISEAGAIRKAGASRYPAGESYEDIQMGNILATVGLTGLFGGLLLFVMTAEDSKMNDIGLTMMTIGMVTTVLMRFVILPDFASAREKAYDDYTEAQTLSNAGYATSIFPITQAVQMADGYNRQLWREMTNR